MTDREREMAKGFYGYGRWEAPFWFLGPEQGQDKDEKDELGPRLAAWESLGKPEFADLKTFHDKLQPGKHTGDDAGLQKTWEKLILLLMSFKGEDTGVGNRRKYQHHSLGRLDGETCLIELSGLPANSLKSVRDRESCRPARIQRIAKELKTRLQTRRTGFVVMYGKGSKNDFESILGASLDGKRVTVINGTPVVLANHPVAPGWSSNKYWDELGSALRLAV